MPTDKEILKQVHKVDMRAQVYHALRRLGYSPEESQRIVDILKKEMGD